MNLFNKIKWVLGVLLVFFLILTTNLIDKDNFRRVKQSISSIYEDRLIVKELIFEISLLVHEKEIAAISEDVNFFDLKNERINEELRILVERYYSRKITRQERNTQKDQSQYAVQIENIKEDLYNLSKIQIKEGRNELMLTKEVIEEVELFTRIEIYLMIFLAVLIQIIILYNPKKSPA